MQTITARTDNPNRYKDPRTGEAIITAGELWTKAPKAAARKATAEGVHNIAVHEHGKTIFIYQICGFTPSRGLYCDILNESGQVVKTR